MVTRKIVHIDEEKCNGCGACANACRESAIVMVEGKARLLSDDYCDGLGNCLPACPTGAITIIEREAAEYDEEKVQARQRSLEQKPVARGCPGSLARNLQRPGEAAGNREGENPCRNRASYGTGMVDGAGAVKQVSRLAQWPVQIRLAPVKADYFANARLLIAADCAAYARATLHEDFMKSRITLIGCPKLDPVDYAEKLTAILENNTIKNVTIVRMEVPCCGGLEVAAKEALQKSGKFIPWQVVTLSLNGEVLED